MLVQANRIPGQLTGAVHYAGMQIEAVGLISLRQDQEFSIRLDQGVADALVRSLRQIVRLELAQGLEEGLLPDEEKPLQAFALEGVDEALQSAFLY